MKIQFTHNYVVLFATAILLTYLLSSCKKGVEEGTMPDSAIVSNAKKWVEDNSKQNPEIWHINQPKLDWINASMITSSANSRYLVVPYKELVRFELKAIALSRQVVFKIKNESDIEGANVLETFAPENYLVANKKGLAAKYLNKDLSSFTGSVIFYNFDYSAVDKAVYRRGIKRGQAEIRARDSFVFGGRGIATGKSATTGRTAACYAVTLGLYDEDGNFTPLYFIGIFCDVEEGTFNNIDWATYNGSNGNTGNGEGPTVDQILDAFDNSIKDSLTNTCLKAILANIKGLNGSQFGEIIKKLSQNVPGWNWVVYDDALSSNNNAETYDMGPNGCITILNTNRIQPYTELALVRTLLHEGVHAFLSNYFRNDPNAAGKDYPGLFQLYLQGMDTSVAQHIAMGTNFVNSIADAIKYYGQGHGYDLPDEVYNDMAWGGLYGETTGVPAFNALTPYIRERIRNRNAAENSSTTRDTEVPTGGQACNF